jgi:hypothetical protein
MVFYGGFVPCYLTSHPPVATTLATRVQRGPTPRSAHLVNRILVRARSEQSRDHREVPARRRRPQRGPPPLRAIHANITHSGGNHTCRTRSSGKTTPQRTHIVNHLRGRARIKQSSDHRKVPTRRRRTQRGPSPLRAIHAKTSHSPGATTLAAREEAGGTIPQRAHLVNHFLVRARIKQSRDHREVPVRRRHPQRGFPILRVIHAHTVTHTGGNHTCGAPSSGWNHPAARTPCQPHSCSRPQRAEL